MKHTDDKFKYQNLKDHLVEQIRSGRLSHGTRIESEPVLGRRFGLSRNTVRQAIGELEQEGLLFRRQGKGTFVRSTVALRTQRIALLIYNTSLMTHPVTGALISGIDEVLSSRGYVLDILAGKRGFYEEDLAQISGRYAGFLIGAYQLDELTVNELEHLSIPNLFVKNYRPEAKESAIRVDFYRAGFLAAEHLAQGGCRRLALVYSGEAPAISAEFRQGVVDAALEYGVRLSRECQIDAAVRSAAALDGAVENLMNLPAAPDGFVCFADEQAMQVMEKLRQMGKQIPQDVAVIGCNDSQLAALTTPALSSVALPFTELGRRAASALLDMIDGKKFCPVCLTPELVVRESTRKIGGLK